MDYQAVNKMPHIGDLHQHLQHLQLKEYHFFPEIMQEVGYFFSHPATYPFYNRIYDFSTMAI
jgi:hypothetical protein